MIALAVDTDDEHGTAVTIASRLTRGEGRWRSALRSVVADALAEAAMAKLIGAAEEFDGKIGSVGGNGGLHRAVMLIAKGEDVGPHRKRV